MNYDPFYDPPVAFKNRQTGHLENDITAALTRSDEPRSVTITRVKSVLSDYRQQEQVLLKELARLQAKTAILERTLQTAEDQEEVDASNSDFYDISI